MTSSDRPVYLQRCDSFDLYYRLVVFPRITHFHDVRRHHWDDAPCKRDVILGGVLRADGEAYDVRVVDEGGNHVYFTGHVDRPQQHLSQVVVTLQRAINHSDVIIINLSKYQYKRWWYWNNFVLILTLICILTFLWLYFGTYLIYLVSIFWHRMTVLLRPNTLLSF